FARDLVLGDIILLETGDRVPADARIIEEANLEIDESMLTGESVPSKKNSDICSKDTLTSNQKNMVFKNTIVTGGKAKCVIVNTGEHTEIGKIAILLSETKETLTPLQKKLDEFMKFLGLLVIIGMIVVLGVGTFFTSFSFLELLKLAIAQAVSFIPEGLPIVVTIVLAIGVSAMAAKKAIVRKLPAVETLGSVSVICTDKTGTLTKNEMTVKQVFVDGNVIEVTGSGYSLDGQFKLGGKEISYKENKSLMSLLKIATLCNDSYLDLNSNEKIIGDPTEGALLVAARKANLIKDKVEKYHKRIGEIQFNSDKKYMVTFNKDGKKEVANIKGAPEQILKMSSFILLNGKKAKLTNDLRKRILKENMSMAAKSLRVLGFAYKETKTVSEKEVKELIFVGLIAMMDPVRDEAKKAVKECHNAGIRVIMITGDHKITAQGIAREIGLDKNLTILTGEEVNKMTDKELEKVVEKVDVYARTSAIHKTRIIDALKNKGHIVAMTGDGINDALAIKKADVGIAMGISGTEVTKEASDLVLEDDNFQTIIEAVKEGRGAYANIKKVIQYLLGTNIGEVIVLFIVLISGLFFKEALPIIFVPIQLLWINLVTDGACVVTLGMEKKEEDIMEEKPRNPKEKLITKEMLYFIIFTAIIIALGTIFVFLIDLFYLTNDLAHARTLAFTTLIFFQLFSAYNARSTKPLIYSKPTTNPYLFALVLFSVLLTILVIYIPILNVALYTVPLNLMDWIIIVGISSTLLLFFEIKKAIKKLFSILKKRVIFDKYQFT
ncbi:MAG: HAD-IC family P-type ATPase, partial [Candidatus ainarchaeum sp.]|nr:HAD-IC family P-type ATPase [Candidatus ainarchaeum sp.]